MSKHLPVEGFSTKAFFIDDSSVFKTILKFIKRKEAERKQLCAVIHQHLLHRLLATLNINSAPYNDIYKRPCFLVTCGYGRGEAPQTLAHHASSLVRGGITHHFGQLFEPLGAPAASSFHSVQHIPCPPLMKVHTPALRGAGAPSLGLPVIPSGVRTKTVGKVTK